MSSKQGKNQTGSESENLSSQDITPEENTSETETSQEKPKSSGLIWLYVLAGCLICTALAELWTTRATLQLQETLHTLQIKIKELETLKSSQENDPNTLTEDRLTMTEERLGEILSKHVHLSSRIEAIEAHLDALSKSSQAAFKKIEELAQNQSKNPTPSPKGFLDEDSLKEDSVKKSLDDRSFAISSLIEALEVNEPIDHSDYHTLIPGDLFSLVKDISESDPLPKNEVLNTLKDLSQQLPSALLNPEDHVTKKLGNFITIRKITPSAQETEALKVAQALASKIQTAITQDDYAQALVHFNDLPQKAKDILSPLEQPLEQNHKKQTLLQKLKSILTTPSRSTFEPGNDTP